MKPKPVLACDLGGTRIKLGLVCQGRVLTQRILEAKPDGGLRAHLPDLAAAWRGMCQQQVIPIASCQGIGLAFPSLMDPVSGRILAAFGKYADAPEVDLLAWADAEFGLPLVIDNDARLAHVGEWQFGAGRNCQHQVMVTLGTGLGSSAIVEGRVLRGAHGQAGCLGGHLTVNYRGRQCHCGNVGCAEVEGATAQLQHLLRAGGFTDTALLAEPMLDYAAVFQHAARGDPAARALQDHSLRVWSGLVVNLIHAYDPELVILGGGIMASAEVILPAIQDYVNRHAMTPWGRVQLAPSQLGDQAALLGGQWLVEAAAGQGTAA